MQSQRHIYSVSELNGAAKEVLEQAFGLIWLEGELSNLSRPASGHWYFSLKDQKAQIRCAFFRGRNRLVNFSPEDGQRILVRGRIGLYEPRGDYQLIVDHMEPAGVGDLQQAYEQLKQRLHGEGLFDEQYKQPLPVMPRQIGLLTSPSGAAIRDALHVLRRRYPLASIIIYPTPVQGEAASAEIINALGKAERRNECDVLLLVRGGGSLEDLWCFNNEALARAIHDCPIPIVTGIGHEIDFTIADFVADARAPTPSAAAEVITPDQAELRSLLQHQIYSLHKRIGDRLTASSQQLDWYLRHLQQSHPGKQLANQRQELRLRQQQAIQAIHVSLERYRHRLSQLDARMLGQSPIAEAQQNRQKLASLERLLDKLLVNRLQLARSRLDNSAHALNTVSPLATLSRGYSISRRQGTFAPLKKASEITVGESLETLLGHGSIISKVESIDE